MARPRKASVELLTVDDANAAMRKLLQAEVELEKRQGALDLARAAATAKLEKSIDEAKAEVNDLVVQLQTWYMGNTKELEKAGKKSFQLTYGIVGRRLGQSALKPLNRAWTWESIAVKLRTIYKSKFFHEPAAPKVDKDLVKATLSDDELTECGLKVEQDETFYAEPDRAKLGELAKVGA